MAQRKQSQNRLVEGAAVIRKNAELVESRSKDNGSSCVEVNF